MLECRPGLASNCNGVENVAGDEVAMLLSFDVVLVG